MTKRRKKRKVALGDLYAAQIEAATESEYSIEAFFVVTSNANNKITLMLVGDLGVAGRVHVTHMRHACMSFLGPMKLGSNR